MSSVLDWVAANVGTYGCNPERVLARGISTGGYYAFRIAHTHANRSGGRHGRARSESRAPHHRGQRMAEVTLARSVHGHGFRAEACREPAQRRQARA